MPKGNVLLAAWVVAGCYCCLANMAGEECGCVFLRLGTLFGCFIRQTKTKPIFLAESYPILPMFRLIFPNETQLNPRLVLRQVKSRQTVAPSPFGVALFAWFGGCLNKARASL